MVSINIKRRRYKVTELCSGHEERNERATNNLSAKRDERVVAAALACTFIRQRLCGSATRSSWLITNRMTENELSMRVNIILKFYSQ